MHVSNVRYAIKKVYGTFAELANYGNTGECCIWGDIGIDKNNVQTKQ